MRRSRVKIWCIEFWKIRNNLKLYRDTALSMPVCAWGYLGVHSAEQNFVVHFAVRYQILTKHLQAYCTALHISIQCPLFTHFVPPPLWFSLNPIVWHFKKWFYCRKHCCDWRTLRNVEWCLLSLTLLLESKVIYSYKKTSSWWPFRPPWFHPTRPSGVQALWPSLYLICDNSRASLTVKIFSWGMKLERDWERSNVTEIAPSAFLSLEGEMCRNQVFWKLDLSSIS